MSAIEKIKTAQQNLKNAFDAYAISHKQALDAIDDLCGVKKSVPSNSKGKKRVVAATSDGNGIASGSTSKKQKTVRKKKHPGAPTLPATGYLRFRSEAYQDVKARYPDLNPSGLTTHIANLWNTLSDEEKEPYNKEYRQAKVGYDLEMTAFKHKLATQGGTPDIQVDAPTPAPAPDIEDKEETKEERKKRRKEKREQKKRDKLSGEKAQKKKNLSNEIVSASDEDIPVD
ncbi:hypothetical protein JCM5353_000384 [Sporobolomyces roseus]